MARLPKKKDEFADLDSDFKDAVAGESPEDIRKRIAQVALNELENQRLKKEDTDLETKKEEFKEAGAVYREASKANKLRLKFMRRVLKDKGNI